MAVQGTIVYQTLVLDRARHAFAAAIFRQAVNTFV
jgi:hypothetical protein